MLMIHYYEILEQDATGNDKSNAGRFNPEVFVNCVQDDSCTQLTKSSGSKCPAFDFVIISCVLLKNLVSLYYQCNYEPLQYHSDP